MSEIFTRGMAAATQLTRNGKLKEATALIQKLLGNRSDAQMREDGDERGHAGAPVTIDGTFVEVTPQQGPARSEPLNEAEPSARESRRRTAERARQDDAVPMGSFVTGTFSNTAGARDYKIYIPVSPAHGARPLIVMLHGCSQSADDFAAGTRMNLLAEEFGCCVVYPEQSSAANASKCWNWFKSADQIRDQGEPSIIAGMVQHLVTTHGLDATRVFIAGLSAGGAAAAVLGEAYPDIFAAVGVHSGLACGAASDMTSAFAAMSGHGPVRHAASGAKAEVFVPTIVFHGDRDTTVHPRNGAEVVARAARTAALKVVTESDSIAGRDFTRTQYRETGGRSVLEDWVLHGAGHAWSGGNPRGSFVDGGGPDASREMMRFFLAQRQ